MVSYNYEYHSSSSDRKKSDMSNDSSVKSQHENSGVKRREPSMHLNLRRKSTLPLPNSEKHIR